MTLMQPTGRASLGLRHGHNLLVFFSTRRKQPEYKREAAMERLPVVKRHTTSVSMVDPVLHTYAAKE